MSRFLPSLEESDSKPCSHSRKKLNPRILFDMINQTADEQQKVNEGH